MGGVPAHRQCFPRETFLFLLRYQGQLKIFPYGEYETVRNTSTKFAALRRAKQDIFRLLTHHLARACAGPAEHGVAECGVWVLHLILRWVSISLFRQPGMVCSFRCCSGRGRLALEICRRLPHSNYRCLAHLVELHKSSMAPPLQMVVVTCRVPFHTSNPRIQNPKST